MICKAINNRKTKISFRQLKIFYIFADKIGSKNIT